MYKISLKELRNIHNVLTTLYNPNLIPMQTEEIISMLADIINNCEEGMADILKEERDDNEDNDYEIY